MDIIPRKTLLDSKLTEDDLNLMLNGKPKLDVEELRAYTIYQGVTHDSSTEESFGEHTEHVTWLWMCVRKMDRLYQGRFLMFVTGTSCVPLDGFEPPFNVTAGFDMSPDSLPMAHTCFNQIVIPRYTSFEIMNE